MTSSLLSSHLHGSHVFVSQSHDGKYPVVQKSTYYPPDFPAVSHEYDGFHWYASTSTSQKLGIPLPGLIKKKFYMRAIIPFLKGRLLSYLPSRYIGPYLDKAILHYIDIWGQESRCNHMHGDLSYANILSNHNLVYFIDWEHFTPNVAYFSFDALHLLLETLLIYKRTKRLLPSHLICAARNINLLNGHPLANSKYLSKPFSSVRSFMEKNIDLWSPQVLKCPSKFPVLTENMDSLLDLEKSVIDLLR